MTKEEFDLLEVRPENKGWYFVTLFQFKKEDPNWPDCFTDWVEFDGVKWDYDTYDNCYVCFIQKRDDSKQSPKTEVNDEQARND